MIKLLDILSEGPRIGELPVRQYKLVQGKEAELAKIKNPKAIDYIKKNPDNVNLRDLAKFLSVREQVALQFINVLKQAGALVSKDGTTTSKSMSNNDVDDLFKEATFTDKYDDSPKLKGKQTELPDELQAKLVKEGDHEVAMAMSSLKSIIKSSVTLLNKLGNEERNIPGWIQDHITNAENYIDQAAQGFHELNHNEMNEQLKRLQELANVKEAFSNRDESVYQDFIKLDGESKLKFFGKIRDWYKTASDPAVKAGLPKQKIVGAINSFMDEYGSYVKKGEDEGDKYDFS